MLPVLTPSFPTRRSSDLRDECRVEFQVDALFLDRFHEGGDIFLDPEQYASGIAELDIDIAEHTAIQPCIAGQIHRLLRRAGALDRHRRLAEDRPAGLAARSEERRVGKELVSTDRSWWAPDL